MSTIAKLLALSLAFLIGCAGLTPHQQAYAAGAISKTIIDEADRTFWDPYVERQTDACDPANNAAIKTKSDFDRCLGPALHDAEVLTALEAYVTAAEQLFALLKSTEAQAEEINMMKRRVLDLARTALERMGPEARKFLDNLQALTRGK